MKSSSGSCLRIFTDLTRMSADMFIYIYVCIEVDTKTCVSLCIYIYI